jgi:hypothetical protein
VKTVWFRVLILFTVVLLVVCWKIRESETPVKLKSILDGETVVLASGKTVKLLGVSTTKGDSGKDQVSRQYLEALLDSRNIWLEYENGRVLMWVGCENTPRFWTFRRNGENPMGCKKGVLVNDQLKKMGWLGM